MTKFNGQEFYHMLDASKRATFGIPDIILVQMQEVIIEVVDEDWKPVSQEVLFMVVCIVYEDTWVATRPHHDRDYVETTANIIADKCKQWYEAHGNN